MAIHIFVLPTPPSNSKMTLKSKRNLMLPRRCLNSLKQGAPYMITTTIQGFFSESQTNKSKFNNCSLHSPFNSRISQTSTFFITGKLMLPRRCLNSLKEPQRWSRSQYKACYGKKPHTQNKTDIHYFTCYTPGSIPELPWNLNMFIRRSLLLPRKGTFKEPQTRSWQ